MPRRSRTDDNDDGLDGGGGGHAVRTTTTAAAATPQTKSIAAAAGDYFDDGGGGGRRLLLFFVSHSAVERHRRNYRWGRGETPGDGARVSPPHPTILLAINNFQIKCKWNAMFLDFKGGWWVKNTYSEFMTWKWIAD